MSSASIRLFAIVTALITLDAFVLSRSAAAAGVEHHFALSATATLTRDQTVLGGGTLSMRGSFQSSPVSSSETIEQSAERFSILARAAAAVQACYYDTVFRDGLDGDGL